MRFLSFLALWCLPDVAFSKVYDHKSIVDLYTEHVKSKNCGEISDLEMLLKYLHDISFNYEVTEGPKHVLTIMTDDQGWQDVGYHDDTFVTPTIDYLADNGVKLNNFYVQVRVLIVLSLTTNLFRTVHLHANSSKQSHWALCHRHRPSGNLRCYLTQYFSY